MSDTAILGVDVWSGSGQVDWHWLAGRGIRFVMIRCGNGNNGSDSAFARNLAGAISAGLHVGAYHVGFPLPLDPAHPGRSGKDQATEHYHACRALGSSSGELPPALDLEWPVPGTREWRQYGCSDEQVRAWALEYLAEAEALYGRKPLLYDGFPNYWAGISGESEQAFANYPLWRVDYRPSPVTPGPWSDWALWQYSGGGLVLPNGAKLDEDRFGGDEDAFQSFLSAAV